MARTPGPPSGGARSTLHRAGSGVGATAYDFRRPIQLSREHLRVLQVAFDTFARQATTVFTSSLRTVTTVALESIEQRSYSEYVTSLSASTYLTIFRGEPIPGRCILEIPLPATMRCIDHMLGGSGKGVQPNRPLTEIESGVFSQFVLRLFAEMRYSLAGTIDFTPEVIDVEYSPQFAQVANSADVVVVVTLGVQIGEAKYSMTLCLPFSGLRPHLEAAAAPATVSDSERRTRELAAVQLETQFQEVPVDVSVRFRTTRVSPVIFDNLEVGDVLTLNHPAAAPLDVYADTTPFAHATPGARGTRLAALIVSPVKEN